MFSMQKLFFLFLTEINIWVYSVRHLFSLIQAEIINRSIAATLANNDLPSRYVLFSLWFFYLNVHVRHLNENV